MSSTSMQSQQQQHKHQQQVRIFAMRRKLKVIYSLFVLLINLIKFIHICTRISKYRALDHLFVQLNKNIIHKWPSINAS